MTKLAQSLANLEKAIQNLLSSVATPPIEDRDFGGVVKAFENVYELSWKTGKMILERNGIRSPFPRVVFEELFKAGVIDGNEVWKEIMEARDRATHTYDKSMAVSLCADIQKKYVPVLVTHFEKLKQLSK